MWGRVGWGSESGNVASTSARHLSTPTPAPPPRGRGRGRGRKEKGARHDSSGEDQRAAEAPRRHCAVRLGSSRPRRPRPSPDLHRPGDLRSGDDEYLRRHLDLSGPRKRNPERQRFHHKALGSSSGDHRARRERKNPGALQPLHPSRHHAVPLGQGQLKIVPMPVSRLEFPQYRKAARRAVAGRLCRGHARPEIQHRPGAAGRNPTAASSSPR